jgi:hypothetical protein
MVCPLCGQRRARRTCPAIGYQICAVCCGTKRLTEIHCPSDCVYLAAAREHPPAAAVRQQQRDVALLVGAIRDLSQRQSELFLVVSTFLTRYRPEFQVLLDEDVAEAAGAIAATYETASRGVIYDHRPASLPAERLVTALKPLVTEAGQAGGSTFERDAAAVFRQLAAAVAAVGALEPANRRAFIDLLGRTVASRHNEPIHEGAAAATRLIVP